MTRNSAEGTRRDLAPDPRLYNEDLAPTEPIRRTWTTYNYIALWFSMSMEVTTYMLASSLIAGGMNWKQAVLTILLGNLIVLIPMLLNAHAGAKYGIPFPVFVRASFGPRGREHSRAPSRDRGLRMVRHSVLDRRPGHRRDGQRARARRQQACPWFSGVCFLGFWLLNMVVVWRGVESIRFLQSYSAPFMIIMSHCCSVFMLHKAGGFGPMLSAPDHFATRQLPAKFFFPSLTAMVGYWATLSLNIPDFTRYREESGCADRRSGLRSAGRHGALLLPRHRRNLRVCCRLRQADLESG